ncbi:MAG TPA: BadF/BadG/BcrA/BcrD ATPase family protein [Planctomycetota bacterium]|nr:BadF/BadG/BcrA/BcrD ATPase family protein [Planctomycetota bacterium]HRR81999.1 BadF/BadG/BcrA/BcrD ATPase family protein [Planctomycetota bacterium]HRT94451.1 BadF/BadG/BcrA/BcrD ATPase family protein [Planctomycetota bacterium]
MTRAFFLGIEGGATKTTGVLTGEALDIVARHVGGPTNVHAVGSKAAWGALAELAGALLTASRIAAGDLAAAALCVSGVRAEEDRRAWRGFVRKLGLGCPALITHDAAAGLAAGSPDGTGILAVCGTGSLVYARRADGAERFVGGRGPLLGDEGSGFDIGHRALRAAARSADGRGPKSLLEALIPQRLRLAGIDALVAWASPFAKDRVAGVAPIVFEAAAAGDEAAKAIIAGAVAELARGIEVAARALWPPPEAVERVVLSGGVLRSQPTMRDALAAAVRAFAPDALCGLAEVEGALGAARLARRLAAGANAAS